MGQADKEFGTWKLGLTWGDLDVILPEVRRWCPAEGGDVHILSTERRQFLERKERAEKKRKGKEEGASSSGIVWFYPVCASCTHSEILL